MATKIQVSKCYPVNPDAYFKDIEIDAKLRKQILDLEFTNEEACDQ